MPVVITSVRTRRVLGLVAVVAASTLATSACTGSDGVKDAAAQGIPTQSAASTPSATTAPSMSASSTTTAAPTTTVVSPTSTSPTVTPSTATTSTRASLAGEWQVHDSVVRIPTGEVGQGTVWNHGCQAGVSFCDVVSDVTITRYGSGLRLTVTHTDAVDQDGRRMALPAGYDTEAAYVAPGDYSILVPFTASDWPYPSTLTAQLQRAVFHWDVFHAGQRPVLGNSQLSRLCRDPFPAGLSQSTYCGA